MKIVNPGQVYSDRQLGRTLTVMSIEPGGTSDLHPQINYARCRADWHDGTMSIAWISVEALLNKPRLERA